MLVEELALSVAGNGERAGSGPGSDVCVCLFVYAHVCGIDRL